MATYRVQHSFRMDDGIPANDIVNTTHWSHPTTGGPTPSDFDNIRDMLHDFYTLVATGMTAALQTYITQDITNTVTVKAYNLSDPQPRPPVYQSTFGISPNTSSDGLPHEVALCLSFQADRVAGENQAHRRNRIYLGPFAENASTAQGVPDPTMLSNIAKSARTMLAAADNSATWNWVVWSPSRQQEYDLVNGWVDNAWDTQRRRGRPATTRGAWTASTP